MGVGELDGKVTIVTGGANGIGRATVERFVEEGARVVIADVDEDAASALADELGEGAVFQKTDVADANQVQATVDFTADTFGRLDVIVNNAGISGAYRRFLKDDLRDFDRVIAVDLFGVMVGSQRAARKMVDLGGGGSIINITSIAGILAGAGFVPYRAAKAGVIHFTKVIAVELAEHGIRVNCVAPGNISTAINAQFDTASVVQARQPLQRLGSPDDIANAIVYLASDRAAQVTGVLLPVDGGASTGRPPDKEK